jgi:prepilin-type N-terminal cleavage/methylation domain-containing protein
MIRCQPTVAHERGETLLELLIAVVILGITAVAVVGGLATGIKMSDVHRKQAVAGAAVRDAAEFIAEQAYQSGCGASYSVPTPPTGYQANAVTIKWWDGAAFNGPCTSDLGVQQVSVEVHSADHHVSETLKVIVRSQS